MAITWRNVDAPDLRGVGSLLASGSELMNQGAAQIGDILQRRLDVQKANWDLQAKDNTMAAINQIKAIKDLNQLEGTDLNQILFPYGGQIDAGLVSDAFGNQGNVIAQGMQNEQTVRTLGDQKQYQSAFNQMLQAYGNGDIKTGDAISAQLQNTTYGDEAANASIAARDRLQQQRYQQAQLANDAARLALERTQIDKENNLNAQKNAIAGIIETARVKEEDPAPAIAQYLGGLKDRSNNQTLSAFADSETKRIYKLSGKQQQEYDQALASLTAAKDTVKTNVKDLLPKVIQSSGLSPTYLGNVGKVGSPNDVNTYVGKEENQIPTKIYNAVNESLHLHGENDINIGSELPDLISQYDPSLTTLDSTNIANLTAYLLAQRTALRIYNEKVSDMTKQANIKSNAFDKRIAEWDGNIKRAYAANDQARIGLYQVQAENIKPDTITIPVDTPTTRALKAKEKAEAERDAANKRAEKERKLAAQGRMPPPQSRAVNDIVDAANNIKAPIGYKPEVALSNLMDFSNVKEDSALYNKWKKEMQAQGKPATSRAAWEKFKADYVKNKK